MGSFGGLIFTNKGINLQAKAEIGTPLSFTRMGIGDGELGGSSVLDLTALKHEVMSLDISRLKTLLGGKASLGTTFTNQDIVTGFYFREIGVFAQDPDLGEILYCYGNAGVNADYIPVGGGPDIVEKTIDVIVIIGNASSVSAVIEESLVFETPAGSQEKVDTHSAENMSHGRFSSINDLSGASGVSLPLGLTDDAYAFKGKCTQASTTNADISILTITAVSGSAFIPVDKMGYDKYAFAVRAKTSNAAAITAVMEVKVSAKNNLGSYIALSDINFIGTDFINGTGDYSYVYIPFELRYGMSTGTLLLPLDLKFEVVAKGSTTNNVTISVDMLGVAPAVPAVYA